MPVKVLHFSTHDENCGIGKYQEMFLDAMSKSSEVENVFFSVSPNKIRRMNRTEKSEVFSRLAGQLRDYDILHIQHEFSFYPNDEFASACEVAKKEGKKLLITVHTSPSVAYKMAKLVGFGPRSILHYLRQKKKELFFTKSFAKPLQLADIVLVHNDITRDALVEIGVNRERIKTITIPVPKVDLTYKSDEIGQRLGKKAGDIIIATTGFIHKFKGIDHAVRALVYLPANYKLAIVGGMHQDHDAKIYNDLCDLIRDLGVMDRVYITGFIANDERLNALIRETDICVYPYEKKYYSNVSSAALNNAYANRVPVVAYPTESFKQLNREKEYMRLTQSFSYYELAREIHSLNIAESKETTDEFATRYSYAKVSKILVTIYVELNAS